MTRTRSRSSAVSRGLRAVAAEVAGLIVPLDCAGCGAPDTSLCPECRRPFRGPPSRVDHRAPRLVRWDARTGAFGSRWLVLAVAAYRGTTRNAVVAWKDRDRRDVSPVLCAAVARAVRTHPEVLAAHGPGELWVVPVPSSAASRRRRGREPVTDLAAAVVRAARGRPGGAELRMVRALGHRRFGTVRDQVGLGARARSSNLSGAIVLRRRLPPDGVACILVDDVLTTGATLVECERALAAAGGRVILGLVVAATPPPGTRRRPPSDPVVHFVTRTG